MNAEVQHRDSVVIDALASARGAGPALRRWTAFAWIGIYLFLAAFPLLVLLIGPGPARGGFAWDFAMALGFGGLAIMGLQFVLTARFRRATAPFGTDIIYYFHRWAALGGLALLFGHYILLRWRYASALGAANPLHAPWHMSAGRAALALFVILIATSLWRRKLRLEYDSWRAWHGVLAVAAVVGRSRTWTARMACSRPTSMRTRPVSSSSRAASALRRS